MSSFVYGRLTSKREDSVPGTSSTQNPPGLKSYVDAFAAIVPAEVLVGAGVFVAAFTDTKKGPDGTTVVITDRADLRWAFYGLTLLALLLFVIGHIGMSTQHWDRWDFLRMLIPPAAFVGWSMAVRPSSLFEAAISITDGHKLLIIVFGGIILGLVAGRLGVTADKKPLPEAKVPLAP